MLSAFTLAPSDASRTFICFPSTTRAGPAAVRRAGRSPRAIGRAQPLRQHAGDPLRCTAIPEFRHAATLAASTQYCVNAFERTLAIATDQRIGALLHRDRAFRAVA